MDNTYTIKEISGITGLKEQFIRKCIMESKGKFDKYIVSRGKNNTINFDSNALVLFDKVKQKKENGSVIPDIISWLFHNVDAETSIETLNNEKNNHINDNVIKSFEEMHREVILAKDETIKTKDEHIKLLESKILLLTDGREPQVVKSEYEKKQEEIIKLQYNLQFKDKVLEDKESKLNLLEREVKESKEFVSKQNSLLSEKEAKLLEVEEKNKKLLEKESKKLDIINQLKSLEGKWFVGSKRKILIKELNDLT